MNLGKLMFWKKAPLTDGRRVTVENRSRFNPLYGITPDRFVRALDSYKAGYVAELCRIMEAYEERDDAYRTNSRKAYASIARCPHAVSIVEGFEKKPNAEKHRETLTQFWANVRVTSAFNRNETGSLRLLKKQMASAIGYGHAVHEIIWNTRADGSLGAEFVFTPPWMFESTTGWMRYLPSTAAIDGEEMPAGGWLVTTGDAIGIASSILAMSKRLSLNDWLSFCERCGQPGIHAKTAAPFGTKEWRNIEGVVRSFGRNWAAVTDRDTDLQTLSLNTSAAPWPPLIEDCKRGIAALWRGADLATMSSAPSAIGSNVQGDEKNILEEDFCEAVSETLHDQVSRFVIECKFGKGVAPLAYLQVRPTTAPNVDADIKTDKHLAGLGVKLSRNDTLARYGRVQYQEGDTGDAPLEPIQHPGGGGFGGAAGFALENEELGMRDEKLGIPHSSFPIPHSPSPDPVAKRRNPVAKTPQHLGMANDAAPASGRDTGQRGAFSAFAAFQRDLEPVAVEVARILELPDELQPAALDALRGKLATLPRGMALAEELEVILATAFAEGVEGVQESGSSEVQNGALANEKECRAKDPANCKTHGTGKYAGEKTGTPRDAVQRILSNPPRKISEAEGRAMLEGETPVKDAAGNEVIFGKKLRDHINDASKHPESDIKGRFEQLPYALHTVNTTEPYEENHRDMPGRVLYQKVYDGKLHKVVADAKDGKIEVREATTYFPRRQKK